MAWLRRPALPAAVGCAGTPVPGGLRAFTLPGSGTGLADPSQGSVHAGAGCLEPGEPEEQTSERE